MTVSLFSRRSLHSVLLLCVCCCSYGVVSTESERDVASGSNTDYRDEEDDGSGPTRSGAEDVTPVSEGSTVSELGLYLGSPCELSCSPRLLHVFCDKITGLCECDKRYPVRLGPSTGCAKPVALGSQCLFAQACSFTDQHAECTQINHNAVCTCKPGYHTVSRQRPSRRVFCSPDQVILSGTDVPTLFGVATGLAILSGLICFVLKLFSRARYSRPRHYANANLAPPILFSSETERSLGHEWSTSGLTDDDLSQDHIFESIPLAVHAAGTAGRPSSRASSQRSGGSTFGSGLSRRPSSGGLASLAGGNRSAGVPVSSSRAGSRRPSLASIHSSASSSRSMSFSARRFEREQLQREARQAQLAAQAQAALAVAAAQAQAVALAEGGSLGGSLGGGLGGLAGLRSDPPPAPSPSPRTPMSTDELLPSVSEVKEEETATPILSHRATCSTYQGEIGPCTSSDTPH